MKQRISPRVASACVAALALLALGLLSACATSRPGGAIEFMQTEISTTEESTPFGGDALAQRRRELERAHHDLIHLHATFASLKAKRERNATIQLSNFLYAYLGKHLDPMLRPTWQSDHPETMALDANIRLVKAQILIDLRDTRRAQETLDQIVLRFQGRDNLLVEFPVGAKGTLGEALGLLGKRKWRG